MIAEASIRLLTPLLAHVRPDLFGTLLPFPYRLEVGAPSTSGLTVGTFDRELGWVNTPEHGADDVRWSYRHNRAGMRADRDVLVGFAADVRAAGATPVVMMFPSEREIVDQRDGRPKVHGPLLAALESRGVPTIDLTDALGEQARSSGIDEIIRVHYRPAGNALVAQVLADRLPGLIQPTCGSA